MKKILILEDEIIVANDIKKTVELAGFNVCTILSGKEDILHQILTHQPDIIISDIYLKSEKTGLDWIIDLQAVKYIPVIFLTAFSTEDVINKLSKIKNDGYLIKPYNDIQLLATLKLIVEKYYNRKLLLPLSDREREIVLHIMNGYDNLQISEFMEISEHTVRTHRKNIYSKLGVNNVVQLLNKLSEFVFI